MLEADKEMQLYRGQLPISQLFWGTELTDVQTQRPKISFSTKLPASSYNWETTWGKH